MCLILFAYRLAPGRPLVVAANRDEFYARPALGAHWWSDFPGLLAGRDQQAGGTWLGVNASGRFAAVTNFTDLGAATPPSSRGALPVDFLCGGKTALEFAHGVQGASYQGFNLLLWDGQDLVCTSNRGATKLLEPGCYALTNAKLGARWPKAVEGAARLRQAVEQGADAAALIELLRNDQPPERSLPGNASPVEARNTPCFIPGDAYGTRASTAVIHCGDRVDLREQAYGPGGTLGERRDFAFDLGGAMGGGSAPGAA